MPPSVRPRARESTTGQVLLLSGPPGWQRWTSHPWYLCSFDKPRSEPATCCSDSIPPTASERSLKKQNFAAAHCTHTHSSIMSSNSRQTLDPTTANSGFIHLQEYTRGMRIPLGITKKPWNYRNVTRQERKLTCFQGSGHYLREKGKEKVRFAQKLWQCLRTGFSTKWTERSIMTHFLINILLRTLKKKDSHTLPQASEKAKIVDYNVQLLQNFPNRSTIKWWKKNSANM